MAEYEALNYVPKKRKDNYINRKVIYRTITVPIRNTFGFTRLEMVASRESRKIFLKP